MKFVKVLFLVLVSHGFWIISCKAQDGTNATGGSAYGPGGSVSYSVGQVFWNTVSDMDHTVIQGVQQPFEISEVSSDIIKDQTLLDANVYPNPAKTKLFLSVNAQDIENFSIQLYDLNGKCILERKLTGDQTEIEMTEFAPSSYILKILNNGINIKTFKIIKY